MSSDFDIDITPSVTTYELYQIASYTHWFSLGEFIDNAITSAVKNKVALRERYGADYRLRIEIYLDHENSSIQIKDNAAGIDKNEMERALRAGEPPLDKSLLSVHGVGMKMSAFWLGRNLNIKTWSIEETEGFEVEIDLDEIKKTKSARSTVHVIEDNREKGTIVTISKIPDEKWPPVGRGQGKLRSLLASMYRLYLNDSEFPIEIVFAGKQLEFSDIKILNAPFWPTTQGPVSGTPEVTWAREFTFITSHGRKTITGRIALLETMSRNLSGLFLHYRGKGMSGIGSNINSNTAHKDTREYYRPSRIFGQEGSYRYQRFTGEFDISALGKTASTDSIKWNEDEEEEFLVALESFLKDPNFNMWAMAENFQARRAKQLLANPNGNEPADFSLVEVDEISDRFLESIRPEVISHSSDEELLEIINTSIVEISREDFLISEKTWLVRDSSNHLHRITPEFIEDARVELFDLVSSDNLNHELRINVGHPFVRRFQWGNKDVRQSIISMIFLIAIPEILLPFRCSSSAFKHKIFEILNSTLISEDDN